MIVFVVIKSYEWYADIEAHGDHTEVDRVFYNFKSAEEYVLEKIKNCGLTLSDNQPEDYLYVCNTVSEPERGEEFTYKYRIVRKYVCD